MTFHSFFTPWTISALVFIALVIFILWRDRANVERHGILFIRRTKKGIVLIDTIAQKAPRFWRVLATLGVVAGFLISIGTFFFLIVNVINNFLATSAQPGLALVLPTLSTEPKLVPGALLTPFWHWIIAIFLVVLVHEGMHGVIGRVEDFSISSVGWGILAVLPLAFVEPEGEQNIHTRQDTEEESNSSEEETQEQATTVEGTWQGGTFWGRLRVLSAGSLANFLLAAVIGLFLILTTTGAHGQSLEPIGLYEHNGVRVLNVANNSPAAQTDFPTNVTITHIDNTRIPDIVTLRETLEQYSPGDSATFTLANNQTYSVILGSFPDREIAFVPSVQEYALAYIYPVVPLLDTVNSNEHALQQLARWRWIQQEFDFLDTTAKQRISELQQELQSTAYVGIGSFVNDVKANENAAPFEPAILFIMQILSFVAAINVGVGMANLLPLKPLDGGLMWEELAQRKMPNKSATIVRTLTALTLFVIVLSFATNFI